ncbi:MULTISPECIES: flavodoxin [Ruminococcus]|uniref:flavodoxin n=1 Tax=Ruminococcus TaxID=1263 RepID=UPI0003364DF7|nr:MULTISPECIES: flavodoxin [Ruminococcus]CDD54049.1 flavodoxin short chain [Ruminococcus sp. CAG:379]
MKTAVIYWSGTGNTEQMAMAVAEGAGADLFKVSEFNGKIADYDRIALGCPAMGAEELEETEFEPFFASIEGELSGKTVGLFGSYGWGDGEWMRSWVDRATGAGATVLDGEGLMANEAPSDEALEKCKAFGARLAQ